VERKHTAIEDCEVCSGKSIEAHQPQVRPIRYRNIELKYS